MLRFAQHDIQVICNIATQSLNRRGLEDGDPRSSIFDYVALGYNASIIKRL